jgi:hypothetical protein
MLDELVAEMSGGGAGAFIRGSGADSELRRWRWRLERRRRIGFRYRGPRDLLGFPTRTDSDPQSDQNAYAKGYSDAAMYAGAGNYGSHLRANPDRPVQRSRNFHQAQ